MKFYCVSHGWVNKEKENCPSCREAHYNATLTAKLREGELKAALKKCQFCGSEKTPCTSTH